MSAPDEADPATLAYIASLVRAEQDGAHTFVRIGPWSSYCLISGLQLTLRHPDLSDEIKNILTSLCREFAQLFEGTPGKDLIEAGFDPSRDVATSADPDAAIVDYCGDPDCCEASIR
jgi:hypothetical protein